MEQNQSGGTLYRNKREQFLVFFLVAFGVFAVTYGMLFLIDFLPERPTETGEEVEVTHMDVATTTATLNEQTQTEEEKDTPSAPLPRRIIFDELDREVQILNPDSRVVSDLDEALLEGVVRHPDSADFVNEGTMFLFGHSSYLPHVINKNFQAFNGIQDLTWGDKIRVQSADREYVYRVDRVYRARASEAEVEIERGTPKLVLATCNSFGTKDDRYVVEATLVDEYTLNGTL